MSLRKKNKGHPVPIKKPRKEVNQIDLSHLAKSAEPPRNIEVGGAICLFILLQSCLKPPADH